MPELAFCRGIHRMQYYQISCENRRYLRAPYLPKSSRIGRGRSFCRAVSVSVNNTATYFFMHTLRGRVLTILETYDQREGRGRHPRHKREGGVLEITGRKTLMMGL